MWLFYFVGFLCLVAFPALFFFLGGRFVLGSGRWVQKMFAGRRVARQLVASSEERALVPTMAPDLQVLDDVLMTKAGAFTADHAIEIGGVTVYVRAQSMIVDERGERMGFPWSREERERANHVVKTTLVVNARGALPPTISLHADAQRDEVSFGDDALYAAIVDGPLHEVLRPGDQISISECCLIVQSPFATRDDRIAPLLDAFARSCRRLLDNTVDGRPDIGALLLENVTADEIPEVRARSIDRILTRFESGDVRDAGIEAALSDAEPQVRFAAARHLGERGFDVAVQIAADEEAGDGLRQRALRFLMRRFETARIVPVLKDALASENERLEQLAARRFGELAYRPAIPWLADLAQRASPETSVVLATALGSIGDPEAELALIALYEKHFDEVKVAAADALGTVGSADAVPHLLAAADSTRVPAELRVAASTAIKLIQSRLRGKAGSLSVIEAEKETGHVSLTQGGPGALSDPVADKDEQIELSK